MSPMGSEACTALPMHLDGRQRDETRLGCYEIRFENAGIAVSRVDFLCGSPCHGAICHRAGRSS